MTEGELYQNPDPQVWAEEFCRICREKGFDPSLDKAWVTSWFANLMMHGHDRALGTWPIELPDGSGVAFG